MGSVSLVKTRSWRTKTENDRKNKWCIGVLVLDNLHETASTGGGLNLEGVVLLVDLAPDGRDEHVLDALAVLNQPKVEQECDKGWARQRTGKSWCE